MIQILTLTMHCKIVKSTVKFAKELLQTMCYKSVIVLEQYGIIVLEQYWTKTKAHCSETIALF